MRPSGYPNREALYTEREAALMDTTANVHGHLREGIRKEGTTRLMGSSSMVSFPNSRGIAGMNRGPSRATASCTRAEGVNVSGALALLAYRIASDSGVPAHVPLPNHARAP